MTLLFENGYSFDKYQPIQMSLIRKICSNMNSCIEILRENAIKGLTPLMRAVVRNNIAEIQNMLNEGCDPEAMTEKYETALSKACLMGNYDAVRIIANALVNVDIPENIKAASAVHWICRSHDIRIAEIILSKGINVNRLDNKGRPGPSCMPYMGDENENIMILNLLKSAGFDVNLHEEGKNTILGEFITSIKFPYKLIEWCLANGADTSYKLHSTIHEKEGITIGDYMRLLSKRHKKMKELVDKYLGPE